MVQHGVTPSGSAAILLLLAPSRVVILNFVPAPSQWARPRSLVRSLRPFIATPLRRLTGNSLTVDPAPAGRRRCDLVAVFAVCDGEWVGVEDLLESLDTYLDCDYEVVAVDDATTDGTYELLLEKPIWVVRNPTRMRLQGNAITLQRAFHRAVGLFESSLYLKMDPDTLVIGPGLEDAMQEKFSEDPTLGLIGTYEIDWNGGHRSFEFWRERFLSERERLGQPLREALRNGYPLGFGVQGGAYCLTGECLRSIDRRGWLTDWHPPHSRDDYIPEDHLMTMFTYGDGRRIGEFGGPGQPFGLWHLGLPTTPDDLLAQGRLVAHALKFDPESLETREFFRNRRASHRALKTGSRRLATYEQVPRQPDASSDERCP